MELDGWELFDAVQARLGPKAYREQERLTVGRPDHRPRVGGAFGQFVQ